MTSAIYLIESDLSFRNYTGRGKLNDVWEHFGNNYQNFRNTDFEYQLITQK